MSEAYETNRMSEQVFIIRHVLNVWHVSAHRLTYVSVSVDIRQHTSFSAEVLFPSLMANRIVLLGTDFLSVSEKRYKKTSQILTGPMILAI